MDLKTYEGDAPNGLISPRKETTTGPLWDRQRILDVHNIQVSFWLAKTLLAFFIRVPYNLFIYGFLFFFIFGASWRSDSWRSYLATADYNGDTNSLFISLLPDKTAQTSCSIWKGTAAFEGHTLITAVLWCRWVWRNGGMDTDRGKRRHAQKNLSQCRFVHHTISHGLVWDRTWLSATPEPLQDLRNDLNISINNI
jgi:hypothetical protein